MKIVRVTQTSIACPSQWDAWDEDNNYYYLRYRSGYGSIRQYQTENWVDADWKPDSEIDKSVPGWAMLANVEYIRTVATFEHGDALDGFIELDEFCRLAGVELSDQLVKTNFGDHIRDQLVQDGVTGILEEGTYPEIDGMIRKWNEIGDS